MRQCVPIVAVTLERALRILAARIERAHVVVEAHALVQVLAAHCCRVEFVAAVATASASIAHTVGDQSSRIGNDTRLYTIFASTLVGASLSLKVSYLNVPSKLMH